MMRIESISQKPDRAGMYRVVLAEGKTLRLYRQTIEDFSLFPGREMEEGELSRLEESASRMSAKMRAVRIISASSVSRGELQSRLERKGESREQAAEAVAWLTDLDLLDDSRTAAQIVSRCISKGYGIGRAKQALFEKRIPKEYWADALADYPDQTERIRAFLKSHITDYSDPKARKRAVDALVRRGFSWEEIRPALMELSEGEDLEE